MRERSRRIKRPSDGGGRERRKAGREAKRGS